MLDGTIIKKMLAVPIVLYFLYGIVDSWLNYDGYTVYTTVFVTILLLLLYVHFYKDMKNIFTYFISFIVILIYARQLIYFSKRLLEVTSNNYTIGSIVFQLIISTYIVVYLIADLLQALAGKLIKVK